MEAKQRKTLFFSLFCLISLPTIVNTAEEELKKHFESSSLTPGQKQELVDALLESSPAQQTNSFTHPFLTPEEALEIDNNQNLSLSDKKKVKTKSPIFRAVHLNNSEKIKKLVANDPTILEKTGIYGQTPLMTASLRGNQNAVRTLIELKARVESTDHRKKTALFYSVLNREPTIIDTLLEAKANVHHTDEDGANALHLAAKFGHSQVVRRLLKTDIKVDAQTRRRNTPLMVTVACTEFLPSIKTHLEVVKLLVGAKASLTHKNKDGLAILSIAQLCFQEINYRYLFKREEELDENLTLITKIMEFLKSKGAKITKKEERIMKRASP